MNKNENLKESSKLTRLRKKSVEILEASKTRILSATTRFVFFNIVFIIQYNFNKYLNFISHYNYLKMIVNNNVVKVKYSQTLGNDGIRTAEEVLSINNKNESLKSISNTELLEKNNENLKIDTMINDYEKKYGRIPPKRKCNTIGCDSTGNVKNTGLHFHYSNDACPMLKKSEIISGKQTNEVSNNKKSNQKLNKKNLAWNKNFKSTKKSSLKHIDQLKSSEQLKNRDLLDFFGRIGYSIDEEGNLKSSNELSEPKGKETIEIDNIETEKSKHFNETIHSMLDLDYDENVSIFGNKSLISIAENLIELTNVDYQPEKIQEEQQNFEKIIEAELIQDDKLKKNNKNDKNFSSTPEKSRLSNAFPNLIQDDDQEVFNMSRITNVDYQPEKIQEEQPFLLDRRQKTDIYHIHKISIETHITINDIIENINSFSREILGVKISIKLFEDLYYSVINEEIDTVKYIEGIQF